MKRGSFSEAAADSSTWLRAPVFENVAHGEAGMKKLLRRIRGAVGMGLI